MKEIKNGIVGVIISLRLIITIPVLIISSILMFLKYVVWAFAGLFVVVAILAVCRMLLDNKFDRWFVKSHEDEDA